MIGAIIGDIVGSRFEFNNHRSTDFDLFAPGCTFTDDTICTVAVAEWTLQDVPFLTTDDLTVIMRKWCRKYPSSYGGNFARWIHEDEMAAYNSFGNGAAMRVSPVAWCFGNLWDIDRAAQLSALISHDHPEGLKGAEAVAHAIFQLRRGVDKKHAIVSTLNLFPYDLPGTCDEIRVYNWFDETCQICVPQAFRCLLESTDFESAIRLAVSIGGDSDTIAAIVGSMAEAAYGVPAWMEEKALAYLPEEMKVIYNEFKTTFKHGENRL